MKILPKSLKEECNLLNANINGLSTLYPASPLTNEMCVVVNLLGHGEDSKAIQRMYWIRSVLLTDVRFKGMSQGEKEAYRDDVFGNPENIAARLKTLIQVVEGGAKI